MSLLVFLRGKEETACRVCPICYCNCVVTKGRDTPYPVWKLLVAQFVILKPFFSLAIAIADTQDKDLTGIGIASIVCVVAAVQVSPPQPLAHYAYVIFVEFSGVIIFLPLRLRYPSSPFSLTSSRL